MSTINGIIRRRLLVNFRVDPGVIRPLVPGRFEIATVDGAAIAGICLIRLEGVHPRPLAALPWGLASENAAYRVAVRWKDADLDRDGVFILRRDSSSSLQSRFGGWLFPGAYGRAAFDVQDDGHDVAITCRAADGIGDLSIVGHEGDEMPATSVFRSVASVSAFFERGSDGYSRSRVRHQLDGMRLETESWSVRPFALTSVSSAFFDDRGRFPPGSVAFDNALVMRDVAHAWHALPNLHGAARSDPRRLADWVGISGSR